MTTAARDWLPRDAANHGVVQETIEHAVARWSERWFVGPYASVALVKSADADLRNALHEDGWRLCRTAIAIRATRPAKSRMVDKALHVSVPITVLTGADQYLLAGLEQRMLQNLVECVEEAFGLSGEILPEPQQIGNPLAGEGGVIVALIDPSGRDLLSLAIPAHVLWAKLKAYLGSPRRRQEPLESLLKPFGAVNVTLEALIGNVELTMAEFKDLVVGDVLVLDSTLDQAVDVAGVGSREVIAKARLTRMNDGIALVFSAEVPESL